MNVWKKALSLVMALSLTLSLIVLPAGAAGALEVSVDGGAVKAGESVTVNLKVANNTVLRSLSVNVLYPSDKLECTSAVQSTEWQQFVINSMMAGETTVQAAVTNPNNEQSQHRTDAKNVATLGFTAATKDQNSGYTGNGAIGTLTFKAKADLESSSALLEVVVDEATGAGNSVISTEAKNGTVTVQGGVPTLSRVGGMNANVTVEGGTSAATTFKAVATSTKNADISTSVTWTVTPADGGVTVGADGTVTVSSKAKAGTYQITATPISGRCQGSAQSARFSVARAAAAASSIAVFQNGTEITGDTATIIKPTAGKTNTYTYTAEVKDQYGDPFEGTVTWNSGTAPTGVTVAGNVVTVSDSAVVDSTFDLNAVCGSVTKDVTLTVKDINITWPTPAVKANATYGDSWSQIVTLSGGSAELNGAAVPGAFTVKGASEYPGAGEQSYVINFKSTDGQYDVDSDAKTAAIAKLAVTIKMNDHKAAYGDTFQYYQFNTVVTGKPLLFSDTVTATASGEAKGDGTDAVGTYKIHGSATHANYNITVTDGTLTIEKKGVAPTETVPSLTVVGKVKTTTDPDTGRTVITGTIEATSPEARSEEDLLKAVTAINPGMVPNVTTFTVTVNGNTATFTFKSWRLAPGQKFKGPGTYEIIPEWECSDASVAQNYEPNLPKLFVEVKGKTETLTVADGKTWTLYLSELQNANSVNGLLPTRAYYSDGTSVRIQGWTYTDGTAVTLSNLRNRAERGRSITLYPVVTPSYLEVESLTVRFYDDTGSSSGGSTGNRGTGGHISITLDPEKIFLNGDLPKDVSRDYWAAPYIAWAYQRGVMNGTGNGNFSPSGLTTRQQLWMVLARLSGEKPASMAEAKAWAVRNGVSDGTNPGASLTRQQLVAMLYRYAQMKGYSVSATGELGSYKDARNVSSYAQQAMAWAIGNGIVTGTTDLRLNPQGTASRSHFAAMMFRFCVKYNV